jgi:L-fuconolactonase
VPGAIEPGSGDGAERRIDAHHHVWDVAVREQPWISGPALAPLRRSFGLAELCGELRAHGIDGTVVVQTVSAAQETPELLALAARHTVVAGVVGWVDLTAPDVPARLEALRAGPGGERLAGIRHQVQDEPDPEWLCRPDVRRGLAAVAAAGLAYDLLTLPHQLAAAEATVSALPEGRFVADHLSKPPIADGGREPWETRIRALAAHPNVTCKLSGMVTEADWAAWTVADLRPYAEVVLDAFGPERLMFGSDWPVCTLAATYGEVVAAARELTAQLTPGERAAVFGGTARAVYRLA